MGPVPETSPKFWKNVAFWQKNVNASFETFSPSSNVCRKNS